MFIIDQLGALLRSSLLVFTWTLSLHSDVGGHACPAAWLGMDLSQTLESRVGVIYELRTLESSMSDISVH